MIDRPATTKLYDRLQSEVHVWFCNPMVVRDKLKLSAYESVLSVHEVERYHRFYFDKDKHSYLVSHALLRFSLSKYADIHASQWQFSSNEHGKPELVLQPGIPDINFNLTHTDGLSACVITLDKPCGIDAENKNRNNKLNAVAQRMFADEELQLLDAINIQQQFFYYWTLREAYVKALGTGLSGSSKEFYFDIDMNKKTAQIHHRNGRQAEDKNWQFRLYEPTQEHVISVAFESQQPVTVQMAELTP